MITDVQLRWLTTSLLDVTAVKVASIVISVLSALLLTERFRPFQWVTRHVSKRIEAWVYLFRGPSMIEKKFNQSNGQPFVVFAPDNRYVFVSSQKHIDELDKAPDTVLSLQAASKQMLQPVYTMHGFNWFDRRGTEGVGFVKALRTLMTSNLPRILPDLSVIIRTRFEELHAQHPVKNGKPYSPVYYMILKLVVLSNGVSFFGKDLARNEAFMKSALAYIEETLICAEIVRLVPKALAPLVGGLIAMRLKSHETIYNTLVSIAEQRCRERDLKDLGHEVPNHPDCIQWVLDTSPRNARWSAKRVVHEVMAIWFGSVHALSTTITFAVHDLCLHPEYVEPLRRELQDGFADFERTAVGLPLLDSFIKESARLTPVESMSTRRSVMAPFELSDGTKLNVGDWACTAVRGIMMNPKFYPAPQDFNGFRFASPEAVIEATTTSPFKVPQPKPSKLTDADDTFHVWGTGRMACPGRYYAASVMKVILGQIIKNYDMELIDGGGSRCLTWRSFILPNPSTMVVFTPLEI